ncbi:MAG TPA: tetratricopeptide repeat protein [Burkholderiales bacterium]
MNTTVFPQAPAGQVMLSPAQALQFAQSAYSAGEFGRAEELCRLILAQRENADALHIVGTIAGRSGRAQEAADLFARVLILRPRSHLAHNNLGNALRDLGRPDDALASYERTLRLEPRFAPAHNNRGNVLRDLKRFAPALSAYDSALRFDPHNAETLNNRGLALHDLGRYEEALTSYERALQLRPDFAEAWNNSAAVLQEMRRMEEALACCDSALRLRPDYAEALNNRGLILRDLGRFADSLATLDEAVQLAPGHAEAWNNRGNTLRDLQRFEEALASYTHAVELNPAHAVAWCNQGLIQHGLRQLEAAAASYEHAIALDPEYSLAHVNHSLLCLMRADFARGWKEYEWRRQPGEEKAEPGTPWDGVAPIAGKTLLLTPEQGLGDMIQFSRYAKSIAERGARVVLRTPRALLALFETLEGVHQLLPEGSPPPPVDYRLPLLSLPLALGTDLSSIPAAPAYLRADAEKSRAWAQKLGPKTRLHVGLVWNGGFRADQPVLWSVNQRRNIELEQLALLKDVPAKFHSLQKGLPSEGDAARLAAAGWDGPAIIDHAAELHDFSDTAALIDNLDLVIAVDTSTAHLAGALGKPVWLLNRFDTCWRWMLEREDSPWYPSMKLYRQQVFNDWSHPVQRLHADLLAFTATR